MATLIRNRSAFPVTLPVPYNKLLSPGQGIVVAQVPEAVIAALGAASIDGLLDVVEAPDGQTITSILPLTDAFKASGRIGVGRIDMNLVALDGGKVLAIGGTPDFSFTGVTNVDLFDPDIGEAGTWTPVAPLPVAKTSFISVFLRRGIHAGKVLVIGGTSQAAFFFEDVDPAAFQTSCYLYDPVANTWTPTGALPLGTISPVFPTSPALELLDGKVLLAGACEDATFGAPPFALNSGGAASDQALTWNPVTGVWASVASMTTGRTFHSLTLLNDGRVLAAGGNSVLNIFPPYIADAEVYDPVANTWTAIALPAIADGPGAKEKASTDGALPFFTVTAAGRMAHGAALLPDGSVLIFGGYGARTEDPTLPRARRGSLLFAPASDTFTIGANMPVAKAPFKLYGSERATGAVFACGGDAADSPLFSSIGAAKTEIYNPNNQTWEIGRDLPAEFAILGFGFAGNGIFNSRGQFVVSGGVSQDFVTFLANRSTTVYEPGVPSNL